MPPLDRFGTLDNFNSKMSNSLGNTAFMSQQTIQTRPQKVAYASHHEPGAADLQSVKMFRKEYRSKIEQQLQDSCILINEHYV
jgi:hypothetical protein